MKKYRVFLKDDPDVGMISGSSSKLMAILETLLEFKRCGRNVKRDDLEAVKITSREE